MVGVVLMCDIDKRGTEAKVWFGRRCCARGGGACGVEKVGYKKAPQMGRPGGSRGCSQMFGLDRMLAQKGGCKWVAYTREALFFFLHGRLYMGSFTWEALHGRLYMAGFTWVVFGVADANKATGTAELTPLAVWPLRCARTSLFTWLP